MKLKNKLMYEKFLEEHLPMFNGQDNYMVFGFSIYNVGSDVNVTNLISSIHVDFDRWGCTVLQYNGVIPALIITEREVLSMIVCKYPNFVLYTLTEKRFREELMGVFNNIRHIAMLEKTPFDPFTTLYWLLRQSDRFSQPAPVTSEKLIHISIG
jgi:hypothetical protein